MINHDELARLTKQLLSAKTEVRRIAAKFQFVAREWDKVVLADHPDLDALDNEFRLVYEGAFDDLSDTSPGNKEH